jgi:hypothetical protein
MQKKTSKMKGRVLLACGMKKPRKKIQNQLLALPKATDFGRTRRGDDCPRYTHLYAVSDGLLDSRRRSQKMENVQNGERDQGIAFISLDSEH